MIHFGLGNFSVKGVKSCRKIERIIKKNISKFTIKSQIEKDNLLKVPTIVYYTLFIASNMKFSKFKKFMKNRECFLKISSLLNETNYTVIAHEYYLMLADILQELNFIYEKQKLLNYLLIAVEMMLESYKLIFLKLKSRKALKLLNKDVTSYEVSFDKYLQMHAKFNNALKEFMPKISNNLSIFANRLITKTCKYYKGGK